MDAPQRSDTGRYLGDAVYGALDGIVTTFAVVAGVAGASLASSVILILGFANLLADGISMAVGNYLSKRSEADYRKRLREKEAMDIEAHPEEHRDHVKKIYAAKGFRPPLLDSIVKTITGDKERWLDETMIGEMGVFQEDISPVRAGATTFAGFVLAGAVPLLSYILALRLPALGPHTFVAACILTGITLFIVGSMRALVIAQSWWRAGLEMLFVGGIAAVVAFFVGSFVSRLL